MAASAKLDEYHSPPVGSVALQKPQRNSAMPRSEPRDAPLHPHTRSQEAPSRLGLAILALVNLFIIAVLVYSTASGLGI